MNQQNRDNERRKYLMTNLNENCIGPEYLTRNLLIASQQWSTPLTKKHFVWLRLWFMLRSISSYLSSLICECVSHQITLPLHVDYSVYIVLIWYWKIKWVMVCKHNIKWSLYCPNYSNVLKTRIILPVATAKQSSVHSSWITLKEIKRL